MRSRVRELLQKVLLVCLLQQHDHVVKKKNAQLNRTLLDAQVALVDKLVVGEVDVLELVGRFLLIRRLVELPLDRAEPVEKISIE